MPYWLDIYFDRTDYLFGVDPDSIDGFAGELWSDIAPSAPNIRIRAYK
jgi:hypothetical protein